MSFEKIDTCGVRERAAEKQSVAKSHVDSLCAALKRAFDGLDEAYAEIDRIHVEWRKTRDELFLWKKIAGGLVVKVEKVDAENASPAPQWTPPKSLANGQYRSHDKRLYQGKFSPHSWDFETLRLLFADWRDAPDGLWKVDAGRAEYRGP